MKKLWSKLFKKNSKSLTPPKDLKKFVDGIERDAKGRWVLPDTKDVNLPKEVVEKFVKVQESLDKAINESTKTSAKKPVAKKPQAKKPTTNAKPVTKNPTTKKNQPKGK